MRVEAARPGELGPQEAARWLRLQDGDPRLGSPFFSLAWARLVDGVRPDARVAVIEDGGEIVAFLPVQRLSAFTAMPIGAPLNDAHGLIAAADLEIDWPAVLGALRVDRCDFTALRPRQAATQAHQRAVSRVWHADLTGGIDAYLDRKRAQGSDGLKKVHQYGRRFWREAPAPRFDAFAQDETALAAMIGWKRAQLRRTAQTDIIAWPWVEEVIRRAAASGDPDMTGASFVLHAGGGPVCVTLCLRRGPVLHTWFTAYDPSFEQLRPGVVGWRAMIEAAAAAGLRDVEMGPGDYQYKRTLATHSMEIADGFVARPSVAAAVRAVEWRVRCVLERRAAPPVCDLPGKVMRRWDMLRALGRV